MSKNKKKNKGENNNEIPIDHQIESKNLQYTLSLKNSEIEMLKDENLKRKKNIVSLLEESSNLKKICSDRFILEKKLQKSMIKNENQEKTINKLNNDLINIQDKYEEEKKELEKLYMLKINQLEILIKSYDQKLEFADNIIKDNTNLKNKIKDLNLEKENLIKNNINEMKKKDIKNEIKFSNIKKKMLEKINKSQAKLFDMNNEYVDISSKLTILENKKLAFEINLLNEELKELGDKNKILEKKIFELNNEIEIHKKVEFSISEKNKKLKKLLEEKGIDIKLSEEIKDEPEEFDFKNLKIFKKEKSESNNNSKLNIEVKYDKIINLEKKIVDLEKRLNRKNDEYTSIKDKYDKIKTLMKSYEEKYSKFYNYLNDCLDNFFVTKEKSQTIDNNNDLLKNSEFSNLSKEEKYSSINILMDNLLPLINECKNINEYFNNDINNNKNHLFTPRYIFSGEKVKIRKNNILNLCFKNNEKSLPKVKDLFRSKSKRDKNSFETLPSIISYNDKKIHKMPSSFSIIHKTDN